ncbi:hypothetical protein FM996_00510 [Methylosinus sporium]|uniref:Uncharacterized protein n=2 Tax=Methylosinus sporium TaxID=428 RepID=A0A549T913_METSR|nr:hypothetical protein FM996_00510 [Methylosinus sporium]
MKVSAPKTRTFVNEIIRSSDGLSIAEIAMKMRKKHPEIIAEEQLDLESVGFKKIIGDVLRWKSGSVAGAQLDFFREFGLPKRISVGVSIRGAKKRIYRSRYTLTLAEAEACVAQRERPPSRSTVTDELKRAIAFAKSRGASSEDKLFEIWREAHGAGGGL